AGVKAKEVAGRLGDLDALPDAREAHALAAKAVTDRLKELQEEQNRLAREKLQRLAAERKAALERQRAEQQRLAQEQAERKAKEEAERQARLRKGLAGLLDRITGKRKRTLAQNCIEETQAYQRDAGQRARLSEAQHYAHAAFKAKAQEQGAQHKAVREELRADIQTINTPLADDKAQRREAFKAKRREQSPERTRSRARDGPDFER
ncbi:MAG: hypothetical protein KAH44_01195, partial [Oricola sp.]|nr:hypothetical protein [Oricola sp.]